MHGHIKIKLFIIIVKSKCKYNLEEITFILNCNALEQLCYQKKVLLNNYIMDVLKIFLKFKQYIL